MIRTRFHSGKMIVKPKKSKKPEFLAFLSNTGKICKVFSKSRPEKFDFAPQYETRI